MKKEISSFIKENQEVAAKILERQVADIEFVANKIINSLKNGGKLITCGNGGSAADSQHMVGELVGRFLKEKKPLAAIALTTNTPILTAVANDYGFDVTFSKQLEALGKKEDILLVISTSGNSKNILRAIAIAKKMGIYSVALTGKDGGELKRMADYTLIVPSDNTPRIQEGHSLIIHILCELIENTLAE